MKKVFPEIFPDKLEHYFISLVKEDDVLKKHIRNFSRGEHLGGVGRDKYPLLVVFIVGDVPQDRETETKHHVYTGYIAIDTNIPDRLIFDQQGIASIDSYVMGRYMLKRLANIISSRGFPPSEVSLDTEIVEQGWTLGSIEFGIGQGRTDSYYNRAFMPFEITTRKQIESCGG
jgi:hypothetical protein